MKEKNFIKTCTQSHSYLISGIRNRWLSENLRPFFLQLMWGIVSVGFFVCIWEVLWFFGYAHPRLLPPPHIFLGDFSEQIKFFNTAHRWQIGSNGDNIPSAHTALLITMAASTARVISGVLIASLLSIILGIAMSYFRLFERLIMPTITLLAPVSPVAWFPVAIFIFGIGNAPAIFMVVISLFFHMVLSTVYQIENVNKNLLNVARTMGATKLQIYRYVIIPAILPGLLMVVRLNLFAAWMIVLIAETTGVGHGLGQVILLARNTFNPSLVFFTIALIGFLGFLSDWLLRLIQRHLLYWAPQTTKVFNGV